MPLTYLIPFTKIKKMVFGWGKKKEVDSKVAQIISKDLNLSDVQNIIDSIKKEQSEHLITQTKKLWTPITQHIESLLNIAVQLEKDHLDTDHIDNNIITIVKRGKKQVLATIHKESERDFPQISSVDDVKIFNKQSSQTLIRIGDILGKQTRVIHIFAKKYAAKLKDILERYKEDISHLKRLLDKYVSFEQNYDSIVELLHKFEKENTLMQNNIRKISSMNTNLNTLSENAISLENNISEFKESQTFKEYQKIQTELDKLNSKKSTIEHEINNQTILISRPMSKYEYGSALDKEQKFLIEKFLSDPFDVFLSPNKSELITILENVKKAISLGHMSVKEPEKTVGYVDIIISKLDEFIMQIESFSKEYNTLNEQLDNLDLSTLSNYEKERFKTVNNIEFSKSRIQELENENETLATTKSDYVINIESTLNQISTVRYILKE